MPRFFQDLIELVTPSNGRVVDLTCFTIASIMATRACGRRFLAFEGDNDMCKHILKPLLEKILKEGSFTVRRIFKILQENVRTSRMRRCLNLSVSKFCYNDCSLNSLVHFYFFTLFTYLIDFISGIRLERGHVSRFGHIDNSYEVQAVACVSHHMPRMLQLQCWISKIRIQMKNLAIIPKSIRNAKVFKYIYIYIWRGKR